MSVHGSALFSGTDFLQEWLLVLLFQLTSPWGTSDGSIGLLRLVSKKLYFKLEVQRC
jgi:hypothetical protein